MPRYRISRHHRTWRSPALVDRVDASSRAFFDLSGADKMALKRPKDDQVRGYSAVGDEGLSYSLGEKTPGDLKELFSIGPVSVPDDIYFNGPAAGPHFAPNLWAPQIPDFEASWKEYFEAMSELSKTLMRVFALGLDLPETYFDDKIDRHISMFRALKYPTRSSRRFPANCAPAPIPTTAA